METSPNVLSAGLWRNAGVFSEKRLLQKFKPGQIWALYSDIDKFPNYYALIEKVDLKNNEVQARWLDLHAQGEEKRLVEGRTIGCGNFRISRIRGTITCIGTEPFSHPVHAIFTGGRDSYEIYPRQGEVWALFKGWDIGWSSDTDRRKSGRYEVVLVLSDFTTGTSITVKPLVKRTGFVSLFSQSKEAPYLIPLGDTIWFSHCVPHHFMSGTEREGIPEGALGLDPAALPLNLDFHTKYTGSSTQNNSHGDDIVNSSIFTRLRKGRLICSDDQNNEPELNEDTIGHNGSMNGVNHEKEKIFNFASENGVGPNSHDASNFKRLWKGGLFCSDDQSKETNLNDDTTGRNGSVNGVNHEKEKVFNSVSNNCLGPKSNDASGADKFNCVDSEFFNFDQLRDVNQFRPNQIWAVYDSQGCMPRLYARIKKVKTAPKFMVQFVWLEFDPANKAEMAWSCGELPVACGHFKHGKSETAKEIHMFSQTVSCQKNKASKCYEIYPRKGEVWAVFKGWDIGWSSDACNHTNYEYEVVQVVSDFTTGKGIMVMPLVRIKGFVSLFMQSKEATPYLVPQDGTLRFSHCVPHHLMSGTEREDIPEGALELDPAALPLNFEEVFASVAPESSSAKGQEFGARYAGSSSEINSCKGSMGVGERQHARCMNTGSFMNTIKEVNREHNTPSVVECTNVDEEFDDIVEAEIECPESEFYEFSEIRLLCKFEPGQIWAIYSDVDAFPNYYAFIKNVDLKNNKVQVRWLDVCPQGERKNLVNEDRTVGCGTFKFSSVHGTRTYTGTEYFSHPVRTRITDRENEYEIIPHLGEIWAVYKSLRAGWTAEDFKNCDYELVEILGHTDSSIQVQHLRKVDGYTAVFRRDDSVKTISKDEYPKFSHQIPCFHLTNENGGKLRGYLELDPHSVPEELLFTDSI